MSRIIVTAAGGSGGRFLTQALQTAGHYVIGTDADPWSLPLSVAQERAILPRAGTGARFVEAMATLVLDARADLVMAQSDAEVTDLVLCAVTSDGLLPTFLPSLELVATAQDKWLTYLAWRRAGVPCAESMCGPYDDEWPHSDIWVRRRKGAGGSGSLKCRAGQESDWMRILHGSADEFVVSEYLPGTNVVVDLVCRDGECYAWASRKVYAWQMAGCSPSGITGASRVTVMHADTEARDVAMAAVRALGLPYAHGVFGVDLIQHGSQYWATEVNAGRFNAPGPGFYLRAGLNLADIAARVGLGESPDTAWEASPDVAYAMLRGQDTEPVYLTRREWDALECE